ncbi:hypothetical protein Hanom_Chr10g00897471 [Helianthus anomalus]
MREMVEKKLKYWFVKDGKRKRTPKTSPVVSISKVVPPKIVVKGPSRESQSSLIDEPVLTKDAIAKDQSANVQTESVKEKQPEEVVHEESGDADDESTKTEPKIDMAMLRIKRKAIQTGVIPRNVRARKGSASMLESQSGKSEKHVETSKVHEDEKVHSVKIPKAPEVQSVEKPEVEKKGADDDVVITEVRVSSPPPPPPPPESQPIPESGESSEPKKTVLPDPF